ncbi:MAG: FG-GAP-like repeat-containing protein [Planctomycetota bacterium]|jgi:hypothetical protein
MLHPRNALAAAAAVTAIVSTASAQQFEERTTLRFPSPNPTDWTNQISVGDIDNDGDLDILFANGGNFGSPGAPQLQRIYINLGTGFFRDESAFRMNFSGLCRGVEMGDVDNDGDLDVIYAQDFNRQPQLFLNTGNGFFNNATAARLPAQTLSSSRAQFGDIDNDGDLDLYITSGTTSRFTCGQYRVYVNDGAGFFTDETASRHPIGNVCNNMDAIFGDIDNDFDLDVRTASTGTNNSRLYRNNGAGVFTQAGIPGDSSCYSYDFGDMDGDGDLDLIGANGGSGNAEILLENNGAGVYTNVSGQISPNPSQDDNDSKFIDYDDDGDLDLLIARLGSGGEKLYNNDGNGNFTQTTDVFEVISDSSLDIAVADVNNDGKYDVITGQGESGNYENRIYMNIGFVDTHPPTIVDTEQVPDAGDGPAGPYVLRALILDSMTSDRNFFDKGIFVNYSVNGGATEQVAMRYSGGQVYRGVIPEQNPGSTVEYWITATDWADNTATGPTLSFEIGGALLGDVNEDGVVNFADILAAIAQWGDCPDPPALCPADLNGSGSVGFDDILIIIGNWTT